MKSRPKRFFPGHNIIICLPVLYIDVTIKSSQDSVSVIVIFLFFSISRISPVKCIVTLIVMFSAYVRLRTYTDSISIR